MDHCPGGGGGVGEEELGREGGGVEEEELGREGEEEEELGRWEELGRGEEGRSRIEYKYGTSMHSLLQ